VLNWNFTDTRRDFCSDAGELRADLFGGAQAATPDASFTLARGVLDKSSPSRRRFRKRLERLIKIQRQSDAAGE